MTSRRTANVVRYKNITLREALVHKIDHVVTHMQIARESQPTWREDYYLAAEPKKHARDKVTRQFALERLIDAYMKEHDV